MKNHKRLSNGELISLRGKTALITGAASVIGEATAYRYAEAGADLQLIDINEAQLARVAERARIEYGVKVTTFVVNLSNRQDITKFWDEIDTVPDILVNNAGVYQGRDFHETDETFVDRMMQINLGAVI